LKIAVDIDGVLADQVSAVLERIEREYGQKYQKTDVNRAHWTFQGIDIWTEISRLLKDPEYVLSIPVIDGARSALQKISRKDLCVVTARRPETAIATKQWLSRHFPCLREYYYAKVGNKHCVPSNILIDDFDLNIVEFVKSNPGKRAILFEQPWSRNDTEIDNYTDQVHFCMGWKSVLRAIDEIEDDPCRQ
jgi:5'(3')-deoxyribonucleotidase